jgi:signal transduction histidine kinase
MSRSLFTSRSLTRLAFAVIIVFVLAQVIWWIIFQQRYVDGVTESTLSRWQGEAGLATTLYQDSPELLEDLQTLYPHLEFNPEEARFIVRSSAVREFTQRQNSHIRMYAYEGPFFVLVILGGLAIIARSLRQERELKRRQQNFLSAITHEFKTPLSTLRLLIETVQMRRLTSEKQRDYLQRMDGELSRLERTSDQVLAAARLEQSREPPVLEALELNSVVQGIIGKTRSSLEARGALLSVVYNAEPLPVSLNQDAFSLVLSNLLDNAVKYSPQVPKPVTVKLELDGDLISLHVIDEGIGLSDDAKHLIFERFYRAGHELTRSSKGVGLGLYLVKSITEAMNGWVKVTPNSPKGTRFSIVLPRRVTTEPHTVLQAETLSL